MRKYLIILFLFIFSFAKAQYTYVEKDTTFGGWLARIAYPAHFTDSTEIFFITHGLGELGTTTNYAQSYGPFYWFNNGMAKTIELGNGTHYPVWVYLQPTGSYPRPWVVKPVYDAVVARFKPKKWARHAMGLSHGGWVWNIFTSYKPTATDFSYYGLLTTFVNIQGVGPTDTYGSTLESTQETTVTERYRRFGNVAKVTGRFRELGFEQVNDNRNIDELVKNMNDSVPGSGYMLWTTFGASGHSNFNDFYNPSQKNWTLSNPEVNAASQGNNSIPITAGWNVYEWALRQGDTSVSGGGGPPPNQPPTSFAGNDVTITLPTSTANLSGTSSDPDGTVASVLWTLVSGPNTPTITTASSASTSVTGLIQGTYVFRFRVTDNLGATADDNVTVTVQPASNVPPIANAGTDQNIVLPTSQVTLNGSGSSDPDLTNLTYQWSQIQGTTVTIVSPTAVSTLVTGFTEGVFSFRLVVTDEGGAVDDDTVFVNVTNPVTGEEKYVQVNMIDDPAVSTTGIYQSLRWNNWNLKGSLTSQTYRYSDLTPSAIYSVFSSHTIQIPDNGTTNGYGTADTIWRRASYGSNPRTLTFYGLNPGKYYGFRFYSGRNSTTGNQNTQYTINGVSKSVYNYLNNTVTVNYDNILPTVSGTIVVSMTGTGTNDYNYLNGFVLIEQATYSNQIPSVDAGSDQVTALVVDTTVVTGVAQDIDDPQIGNPGIASVFWSQDNGPKTAIIDSPFSYSTVIRDLDVVGTYVFRFTVTDLDGASASDTMRITVDDTYGLPLIANAGADMTVALTQPNGVSSETSVTLNASGSQNASQFLWESIGNSATIHSPFTKTTKISGLVAGNNLFKFTVSDGTNFGYDTINIRVVDWQARGKRPCRVGAPVVHELTATSTTQIYRLYLERDYPQYADIKGGDTIKIARNPNNGGVYTGISIGDFGGSPGCPVIIVPKDTVVTIGGSSSSYFRIGGDDTNYVSHVIIDGTHLRSKGIKYGFQHVQPTAIDGPIGITATRVSNLTIKGVYFQGVGVGALIKQNSDSLREHTLYNKHRMYNIRMEDNYFKNINGEAVYLGHTAYNGNQAGSDGHVPRIDSLYFLNNVIDSCEWDGPQLSNGRYTVMEGNTVTRVGLARLVNQRSGLLFAGNCTGKIANNILVNSSDGIVGAPYGRMEVYNNFVDSVNGGVGNHDAMYLSSASTASGVNATIIEDNPPVEWRVYNNIIRNPQRYAVYLPNNGGDQIKGKISDNYIIDATRNEGQLINTALGDTVTNNTIYTSFPVTVRQEGNSVIGNNLMVTANGETRYFDNAYAAFDFIKFKLTGVSSTPARRVFRKIKATSRKRY